MDEIIRILEETKPGEDFTSGKGLIDNNILDSFDIIALVGELNDAFDIEISASDLLPENFNSPEAIYNLVIRLQNE